LNKLQYLFNPFESEDVKDDLEQETLQQSCIEASGPQNGLLWPHGMFASEKD